MYPSFEFFTIVITIISNVHNFFLGRLGDKVTITYNGLFICETNDDLDAIEAHLIQFSLLYAFDVSFETDEKGAKFADNIRYFFEFITVYIELLK